MPAKTERLKMRQVRGEKDKKPCRNSIATYYNQGKYNPVFLACQASFCHFTVRKEISTILYTHIPA